MTDERRTKARQLLAAALERDTAERKAFLDRECGDDHELRREVEALLAEHERTGPFDQLHREIHELKRPDERDQLEQVKRALAGPTPSSAHSAKAAWPPSILLRICDTNAKSPSKS